MVYDDNAEITDFIMISLLACERYFSSYDEMCFVTLCFKNFIAFTFPLSHFAGKPKYKCLQSAFILPRIEQIPSLTITGVFFEKVTFDFFKLIAWLEPLQNFVNRFLNSIASRFVAFPREESIIFKK